jgi:hypothetical protein
VQVARIIGSGKPLPRVVFSDADHVYKVWRRDYRLHRRVFFGAAAVEIGLEGLDGRQQLPGFLLGLYDESVCPAFVSNIYFGDQLAGYIMRRGRVIDRFQSRNPAHDRFLARIIDNSLASGFGFRDLKPNNIIEMPDGRLSLIDLDTPLASLKHYSPEREVRGGSLASFTLPEYQSFLRQWIDPRTDDPRVLAARARMAEEPPILGEEPGRPDSSVRA